MKHTFGVRLFQSWPALLFLLLLLTPLSLLAQSLSGPLLQVTTQGTNAIVSWPVAAGAFGVEYTCNLQSTNWTVLPGATLVGTNYIVVDPIGVTKRYYRMFSPCGVADAPTLGPVPSQNIASTRYILFKGAPLTDPANVYGTNKMNALSTNVLDASAFIDPDSCTPGTLVYFWTLSYSDTSGIIPDLTDQGITGTTTPVLQIIPESCPSGGTLTVLLTVASTISGLQTRVAMAMDTTGRGNIVTISYYNTCQAAGCDPSDVGCACQVWAAMPAPATH